MAPTQLITLLITTSLPTHHRHRQVLETVQANKVMDWLTKNCGVKVLPQKE